MDRQNVHVFYDGSCRACSALVERADHSGRFSIKDITRGELPEGVSFAAANRKMHVVADGKTYTGAAALIRMLEEYPRWRWLAALGKLPGLRTLLEIGYALIARIRHWFGRRR